MSRRIVFFLVTVAAVLAPVIYAGPQLASDLRAGGDWTFAADLTVKESGCTRWYYLVSTCGVEYLHRSEPDRAGGSLNYLVFGSWAGERAILLRSTTEPGRIGSSLGREHMRQRLISFAVFAALALAYLWGIGRLILRQMLPDDEPASPGVSLPHSAMPAGPRSFGRRRQGA